MWKKSPPKNRRWQTSLRHDELAKQRFGHSFDDRATKLSWTFAVFCHQQMTPPQCQVCLTGLKDSSKRDIYIQLPVVLLINTIKGAGEVGGGCGGGTSAQHRSGWQSASEALKDEGQRRQHREERCDGAPTGSCGKRGELSRCRLSLPVTSVNRSVPCVECQPVYTANTWHTLNPRQLSTALHTKDSTFLSGSFFQWIIYTKH